MAEMVSFPIQKTPFTPCFLIKWSFTPFFWPKKYSFTFALQPRRKPHLSFEGQHLKALLVGLTRINFLEQRSKIAFCGGCGNYGGNSHFKRKNSKGVFAPIFGQLAKNFENFSENRVSNAGGFSSNRRF